MTCRPRSSWRPFTIGGSSWNAPSRGARSRSRCSATTRRRPRCRARSATGEWYDYETKYGAGQTTFKVPAALPPATTELIRALAVRAFQAIDCAGMARVDFFVETDGRVLVNEINTIPGFTATSAYARLWEASGIAYPELIARLIELALERR